MEWETRPLSIVHRSREWNTELNGHGPPHAGPSNRASMTAPLNARRRPSSSGVPPLGPPPSQPIPSLPVVHDMEAYESDDGYSSSATNHDRDFNPQFVNVPTPDPVLYQRPSPSRGLAAVAAFSENRYAAATISTVGSSSVTSRSLSESPPRSLLPQTARSPEQASQVYPDRLMLSPPESSRNQSSQRPPSSRRALTRALELAREAVRLDSTNNDPYGAIRAYGESVSLLSDVMERVMRGEDSTESRRAGKPRNAVAQEEEIKRLKTIHDTYADRMNILSLIYSIPLGSQQPDSPVSTSGSSDRTHPYSREDGAVDDHYQSSDDGTESVVQASSTVGTSEGSSGSSSGSPTIASPSSSGEPMIVSTKDMGESNITPHNRPVTLPPLRPPPSHPPPARPRVPSNLPPQPPAPSNSPPGTPSIIEPLPDESHIPRHSHNATEYSRPPVTASIHKRSGSGSRLVTLREETIESSLQAQQSRHFDNELELRSQTRSDLLLPGNSNRDSHPLPPIPTSESTDSLDRTGTPRAYVASQTHGRDSPRSISPSGFPPARRRGPSVASTQSEATPSSGQQLISPSTAAGTIFKRRNNKTSLPASTDSSITEGSEGDHIGLGLPRLNGPHLPASVASSLGIGRNRAASQPVRPSAQSQLLAPETSPRPPFIQANTSPGAQPPSRKLQPSPSGRQNGQSPLPMPPQTAFLTTYPGYATPPLTVSTAAAALVPPPPSLSVHLPTTPTSPLPPIPPTDPLRKPYHLMNMICQTMTSKSGGYITRRLHVPSEVWTQGGIKLNNLPEKVRAVEILCDALSELQNASVDFCGPMGVTSGMGLGVGSVSKKEGEVWAVKLDEFLVVCDGVVGNFGKKLAVGEGFVVKKTSGMSSWSNKLGRRLDKLTNAKNLDSPASYVQGLTRLFQSSQLLDEHIKALCSHSIAPTYLALPAELRASIEQRLKRTSEFFASVVLTFVIRDLSMLLDKYVKRCEKWLEE